MLLCFAKPENEYGGVFNRLVSVFDNPGLYCHVEIQLSVSVADQPRAMQLATQSRPVIAVFRSRWGEPVTWFPVTEHHVGWDQVSVPVESHLLRGVCEFLFSQCGREYSRLSALVSPVTAVSDSGTYCSKMVLDALRVAGYSVPSHGTPNKVHEVVSALLK